jgi:hypothetical protein
VLNVMILLCAGVNTEGSLDWYLHILDTYSSHLQVTITVNGSAQSTIHYGTH